MKPTKIIIAITVIINILITAGTVTAQSGNAAGTQVVWSLNPRVLAANPPVALIRPAQPAQPGHRRSGMMSSTMGTAAMGATLKQVVCYAYDVGPGMRNRIILPPDAPSENAYDFMDTHPQGGREALQQALHDQFGFAVKHETRQVSVLLLTVKNPNATHLKINNDGESGGGGQSNRGKFRGDNVLMTGVAAQIESLLGTPVLDQTGLTGRYDYELSYPPGATPDKIKQAIADQLGLELTPAPQKQPMEFLVVEKTK